MALRVANVSPSLTDRRTQKQNHILLLNLHPQLDTIYTLSLRRLPLRRLRLALLIHPILTHGPNDLPHSLPPPLDSKDAVADLGKAGAVLERVGEEAVEVAVGRRGERKGWTRGGVEKREMVKMEEGEGEVVSRREGRGERVQCGRGGKSGKVSERASDLEWRDNSRQAIMQ